MPLLIKSSTKAIDSFQDSQLSELLEDPKTSYINTLKQKIQTLEKQNGNLKKQNDELKQKLEALQRNIEEIEKIYNEKNTEKKNEFSIPITDPTFSSCECISVWDGNDFEERSPEPEENSEDRLFIASPDSFDVFLGSRDESYDPAKEKHSDELAEDHSEPRSFACELFDVLFGSADDESYDPKNDEYSDCASEELMLCYSSSEQSTSKEQSQIHALSRSISKISMN